MEIYWCWKLPQTKWIKKFQLYKSEKLFIQNTNSMHPNSLKIISLFVSMRLLSYKEEEVLISLTSFLQRGQVELILSHLSTQSTWKTCTHGSSLTSSSSPYLAKQMQQLYKTNTIRERFKYFIIFTNLSLHAYIYLYHIVVLLVSP